MSRYNPRECLKDGSAIAVVIGISAVVLIIIYLYSEPSNTAAWFQSVGSIAAIILGFMIATFQSERNLIQARLLEKEKEKNNLIKFHNILKKSFFYVETIKELIDNFENQDNTGTNISSIKSNTTFAIYSLTSIKNYLSAVPFDFYPNEETLTYITAYIEVLKIAINLMESEILHIDIDNINKFELRTAEQANMKAAYMFACSLEQDQEMRNNFKIHFLTHLTQAFISADNAMKAAI